MFIRFRIGAVFLALILGILLTTAVAWREFIRRNGHWLVRLENVPAGLRIRAVASNNPAIVHQRILADRRLAREYPHVTRQNLPADLGTTKFYDDTVSPGRWTFTIDGMTVDLMESRMEIDP